uniref:cAMP-regulated D2 protein-like isoform X1 n=1 Tax=Styela clava TaxID=7725 RepID=UPI00193A653B|nr:cAMP-regulated D2 protein-like isoform X1 [Styela clava]
MTCRINLTERCRSQPRKMNITYLIFVFVLPVLVFTAIVVGMTISERQEAEKPEIVVAEGKQGIIVGLASPEAGIFQGIPFSHPPTGQFRWKKPQPLTTFSKDIWNATYVRPGCPQTCTYKSKKYTCPDETNEDCLYLNVWVPQKILEVVATSDLHLGKHYTIPDKYQKGDEESLAVMVYLHGGNFMTGAGSARLYDGRFIADQGNVIVVSTNFRLGALGFLVQGDGEDAALGNYGIWDQIAALKWIQENIKFFGGNPKKITLFGQSSGAESVAVLMTSPDAKDLFHRAIMSSNPMSVPLRDVANARQYGAKFAEALGCLPDNMTCIRSADTSEIIKASQVQGWSLFGGGRKLLALQPWGPVIDGKFLMESPLEAFKNKRTMKIPVIIGGTVDEGMFFVPEVFKTPVANFIYQFTIGTVMPSATSQVLKEYPACSEQSCDNRFAIGKIITDYAFLCPERATLFHTRYDSWFYIFNESLPIHELWDTDFCFDRVCHCADLPFIFNTVGLSDYKFDNKEQMLAKRIVYFWTNFAKYGNPNGEGEFQNTSGQREEGTYGEYSAAYWPRFTEQSFGAYSAIELKSDGDKILSDPYQKTCMFWDELDSYGTFR